MASSQWSRALLCVVLVFLVCRASAQERAWSYEGLTGPAYWADIVPGASLCSDGAFQSPINIDTSQVKVGYLGDLVFNYTRSSRGHLYNNGHTVMYRLDNSSSISTVSGGPLLLDLHYLIDIETRAPSEHTINGRRYPMEMYFIHSTGTASNLQTTVVSMFVEEGTRSAFLDQYIDYYQKVPKENDTFSLININIAMAVPSNTSFLYYKGSRTTPTCDEGVTWLILNQPMMASREQIQAYTNIYSKSSRPTQLLRQRNVYQHLMGVMPCQITHPASKLGFPWELLTVFIVIFFGIFLLRSIGFSSADPFMPQ